MVLLKEKSWAHQWFNDFHGKGNAIPYSLDKLQERGKFFVAPNEEVYMQVIGENSR